VRRPEDRTAEQGQTVARLAEAGGVIEQACELTAEFARLVRTRQEEGLTRWMEQAEASGLEEFQTFVKGLRRDEAAVRAGLSLPWSNGPTEGNNNRLKLLKRSMYGRANFDLLRKRVLLAA
jgi:transposase